MSACPQQSKLGHDFAIRRAYHAEHIGLVLAYLPIHSCQGEVGESFERERGEDVLSNEARLNGERERLKPSLRDPV